MDSPTTVAMAATAATAVYGRRWGPTAVAVCATAAFLPDLDGLFLDGPLAYIRDHRSWSHSLAAAPAGALFLAGVAKALRSRVPFPALFLAALTGFAVAIGTDLLTWWGTQILWPFSRARIGVGVVFIIDLWLSAIVLSPWIAAAVRKLRRRPFPFAAFRVATALVVVWIGVCFGGRVAALGVLDRLARESGARAAEVFPQPLSPFRWSLVLEHEDRHELRFHDLLLGGEPETREFPKAEGGPIAVTDATEEGRTLLWFYRVPVREVRELDEGRFEVLYHDLAFQIRLPFGGRREPFRYRFLVEGNRVVEQGWLNRR